MADSHHHLSIASRRLQWDATKPRRLVMNFDELLDAFKSECISFRAIGDANNVTRERIRQIYQKWFADLCEAENGRERVKACTVVNHAVLRERLAQTPFPAWQDVIWSQAKAYGFTPRRIVSSGYPRALNSEAMVGNARVNLRRVSSSSVGREQVYGRFNYSVIRYDVVIVVVDQSSVFVLPKVVLNDYLRRSRCKDRTIAYLPVDRSSTRPDWAFVDWWQYHEAWHILDQFMNLIGGQAETVNG